MFLMSLRMMGKTTSRWAALIGNAQRGAFCVEEAVTKLVFVRPAEGGDGDREQGHQAQPPTESSAAGPQAREEQPQFSAAELSEVVARGRGGVVCYSRGLSCLKTAALLGPGDR